MERLEQALQVIPVVELETEVGDPTPLGATPSREGVNFAVVTSHAEQVSLVLYSPGRDAPLGRIDLDPRRHRTGHVWHVFVAGLEPGVAYAWKVLGNPSDAPEPAPTKRPVTTKRKPVHGIDPEAELVDPYARALEVSAEWGEPLRREGSVDDARYRPRSLVVSPVGQRGVDVPIGRPMAETVLYELHVRGFTRHGTSDVAHPGTYSGLAEKIPYLKELGVTAVELLPIHEFNELENRRRNPRTGEHLFNYWGYSTVGYFAPKASYAARKEPGGAVREFRDMVRAFHAAGIEVILDVVYNHTAEGNGLGPTLHFKGLDNAVYYILDPVTREYHNYSGCGNTVNTNHPIVQDLVLDSLRYWVTEFGVDGFRFDLASIFCRGQDGAVLKGPPILARIAADPVLANTKLIAEAWDAAGLYQVGGFPHYGRWAEWNGKFRDDVRRFVKGDAGMVQALAARLTGSPDLYEAAGRPPTDSVNFVTAHDGFTLLDTVSYDHKHNGANGEEGRDGCDANYSWNCGKEGPTDEAWIRTLRVRQMKNLVTVLLASHGTPMLLAGDELGRTQQGNNNAYCQDNEISWVDWSSSLAPELHRFHKTLLSWRRATSVFRPERFSRDEDGRLNEVAWHGVKLGEPDWSYESRSLAAEYHSEETGEHFFLVLNAHVDGLVFELPRLESSTRWWRVLDTSLPWPRDICEPGSETPHFDQRYYHVAARSSVLLVAR